MPNSGTFYANGNPDIQKRRQKATKNRPVTAVWGRFNEPTRNEIGYSRRGSKTVSLYPIRAPRPAARQGKNSGRSTCGLYIATCNNLASEAPGVWIVEGRSRCPHGAPCRLPRQPRAIAAALDAVARLIRQRSPCTDIYSGWRSTEMNVSVCVFIFICMFSRFNFSSIFSRGVSWPHLPLCADAHGHSINRNPSSAAPKCKIITTPLAANRANLMNSARQSSGVDDAFNHVSANNNNWRLTSVDLPARSTGPPATSRHA